MEFRDIKAYLHPWMQEVERLIQESLASDIGLLNATNAQLREHPGKMMRSSLTLLAAAAAVVFWRIRHHRNKVLSDPVPDASAPTKEDLTRAVSSNSRYVSDSINAVAGCSFIDYVNNYRIRYAQRLLYEKPDMSLSEISEESGFSSEVTFYRNFKARTGQTPGEWLAARNRS